MKKIIILFLFISSLTNTYSFRKLTILADSVPRHTGPFYVKQSLLNGLDSIKFPHNINPPHNEVGDVVAVLSGINHLKTAIQWKQSGKIACLVGGPNIMNSPKECNFLFTNKQIDACLVPSYWTQVAYEEDAPALKGCIRCWYSGVNANYWNPFSKNKNRVLVYWKTESESFCREVEKTLRNQGYDPVRIRYGSYQQQTYRSLLDQSEFAVFITRSESQGIALAEAWAMNVPTLNFDPKTLTYLGRRYSIVSSCPYLSDYTGRTWKSLEDLDLLLRNYEIISQSFKPRKWIIENMTNEASAHSLLNIIEELLN